MTSVLEQLEAAASGGGKRHLEVRLDDLQADPRQPRKGLDNPTPEAAEALAELAASIAASGVIEPLAVRPAGDGTYVIIAGERRWRAARRAGLQTVPCIVHPLDPEDTAGAALLALAENLQREELTPLETAHALKAVLEETGWKRGDLARRLGKSAAWVSHHLYLLKTEAETAQGLEDGTVTSPQTARLLDQLPRPARRRLLNRAEKEQRTVTRAEAQAAFERTAEIPPAEEDGPDGPEELEEAAGAAPEALPPLRRRRPPPPPEPLYHLPALRREQLERLFALLGGTPPATPMELREAFLALLDSSG